ncbi:hypothetical protein K0G44_22450, partial [Bacteroides fragilis]|nr:hypothetical protein [Bacteroides fragilis]
DDRLNIRRINRCLYGYLVEHLFFSIKYIHILRPVDRAQSCIGQYTMKFSTGPARLHCRQSHFTFCLISSSFPLFLFIALLFDRLMLSKTYTFCIQN